MSTYEWPARDRAPELADEPGARGAFVGPRRVELDADGASAAARRTPPAPARRGRRPAAPPSGRANLWVPLGPATVVGSQTGGQPRVAGRVNALAISDDGLRVYAATGNGGVWFSADAGGTWRALGGFAPTATREIERPATRNAIGTIALRIGALDTVGNDQVFVGTGEAYHFPGGGVTAQAGRSRGGIGILTATGPALNPADNNPWTREAPNLVGEAVNRVALQPGAGATGAVAATTIGLYARPAAPGLNLDWEPVDGDPFDDLRDDVTDALWTPAAGAAPERLWAWVEDGAQSGLWVRDAGSDDFRVVVSVGAAGTVTGRGALAASTPASQVWLLVDQGSGNPPLLWRVTNGAGLPSATQVVNGVADFLNGQGFYDLTLTVDPARPNRLVVGGATFPATAPDGRAIGGNRTDDAAVIWADVALDGAGQLTFGQPNPPVMVGVGVHADVHDVRFSDAGARLWVACDGGVFRSDNPTSQVGFFPRNTGLSVIETNYLAAHPTCEGFMATGLQDNGVISRVSTAVWKHEGLGDGGGIVLDPLHTLPRDRWFRQFFRGRWESSSGGGAAGSLYTRPMVGAITAERDAAAFYSTPAAVAHRRGVVPPPNPNVAQVVVGTNRLWYTEDFGVTWVTLPTGTDGLVPVTAQDALPERITVCRWQSPDVAWVLTDNRVVRYFRDAGTDNAVPPGTWHWQQPVIQRAVGGKKDRKSATGPMRRARLWTELAVNEPRGTLGAVYLGTIGDPDDDDVDTLWWFDGTSTWHPTGLRNHSLGVPAPVTVVACDPAHPEEVWVGTTVGVWRGIRSLPAGGGTPSWDWRPMVNGLPEASVEDLAIFSDGGVRLLRAAIASRGVWELQLDVAETRDLTYLRAHDDDLRYRAHAVELKRDRATTRSWHGSPDVRPRVASAARTAPGTLPWQRGRFANDVEGLRRFQAALRSRTGDPRVRATGRWDDQFNEVLRSLGAPAVAPPPPPPPPPPPGTNIGIDAAFWNANMVAPHSTADPWGAGPPSEEDLYELTPPLGEGDVGSVSCRLDARAWKVDVVVHHRGLDPRPGGDVRVTLLRWIDDRAAGRARPGNSANWVPDPVPWTAAVNDLLNGAGAPAAGTFAHGWRFAEANAANWMRTPAGQTLDGTRSGVVTFDLDMSAFRRNTVVVLVAVIRAGTADAANDIALAPGPLRLLALDNPQVAVRSIAIGT